MGRVVQSKFNIEIAFYIFFALALLISPLSWVFGWVLAVAFHEFCHYIVLRLYKIPVCAIKLSAFGAEISAGYMTAKQEIICALAGPLGSLVLLSLLHIFPYVALCALGQLFFNILPIYPLDGGRILTGICLLLFGAEKGLYLSKVISSIFFIFLSFIFATISFYFKLGIVPVILILFAFLRIIKIPCKEESLIVQ